MSLIFKKRVLFLPKYWQCGEKGSIETQRKSAFLEKGSLFGSFDSI